MQLKKYKITTPKLDGYIMVTYHNGKFKSVINEFKSFLTEAQLNGILNYIPVNPDMLESLFLAKYGDKVKVEPVKAIGAEPELDPTPEFPANAKVALWCKLFMENIKDELNQPLKYKCGPAEAGKLKALPVTPEELEHLLEVYFKSDEWYLKPKSISNFVKKYNEVRMLAYAKTVSKTKTFPLPFDAVHFSRLSTMDQRAYWDYLRANGYEYVDTPGRGGKWEKKHTIIK